MTRTQETKCRFRGASESDFEVAFPCCLETTEEEMWAFSATCASVACYHLRNSHGKSAETHLNLLLSEDESCEYDILHEHQKHHAVASQTLDNQNTFPARSEIHSVRMFSKPVSFGKSDFYLVSCVRWSLIIGSWSQFTDMATVVPHVWILTPYWTSQWILVLIQV